MPTGYEWLHEDTFPAAWLMDGSCVTFIREVSVDAVAQIAKVRNMREIDFSSGGESPDRVLSEANTVAMFRDGEWTVVFAWSSLPEQLTYKVAGDPSTPEVVLVYWDINVRASSRIGRTVAV